MSTDTTLVTLTGDGTFRVPDPAQRARLNLPDDPYLAALLRLRALLGDDLDSQIATRLYLPSALGQDPTDHVLPATLAMLGDTTGDLASYGWRLGTGAGQAWRRAHEQWERMLGAARIALHGYEGPLMTTALGPATLTASTFLQSGERTLGDPGAVRDLPILLAEGLVEHLERVRDHVPGAKQHVLLREDAVAAVHEGRIPTPSGRRRYDPVPADVIGRLWRRLVVSLEDFGLSADEITLGIGANIELLRAARGAGVRRLAIGPRRMPDLSTPAGRSLWEAVAEEVDRGAVLELIVDPRPGGMLGPELERMLDTWRRLGHTDADAAGVAVIAHTGIAHEVDQGKRDPALQPDASSLLDEPAITDMLRIAPQWAERLVP